MEACKLTKRTIDACAPKSDRYTLFDTLISGFGIRVYPSGAKSFIFEYRPGEGGRRTSKKRITIGKVGDLTPEQARKHAEKLRAQVRMGEDPQGEKTKSREAPTFAEVAQSFLIDHVGAKRKATTKAHYEDVINRLLLPKIGKLKAKDINRADIARIHLANSKTPFQANRILAITSSIYSFAGKNGLVPEDLNPARGIEKYKEQGRERYLSVEELERLGAAIRLAETKGIPWKIDETKKSKHLAKNNRITIMGEHAAAAIRLLIFTGARLREILHLEWSQVDFERGLLFLPDSKSGQKVIVLNAPALAVLANLTRAGKYVIAGESVGTEDERPRSDLKRPWAMVTRQAGLEGLRIHDLRHNYAAFGAGGGMGLPIIGKLLGHTQPQTTARYAHLDNDPLKRAANTIGETLANAMGESNDTNHNVIDLRQQR